MENNTSTNGFSYTYSAKDREEVKKIREKYVPCENKKEDKMLLLRRLDNAVTQKAQAFSLVFGVVSTLILGFGMSLVMTDLSKILGAISSLSMLIGIIIGIIGGILISLAYPIYNAIIKRERKKIAPEILRLTDELMK